MGHLRGWICNLSLVHRGKNTQVVKAKAVILYLQWDSTHRLVSLIKLRVKLCQFWHSQYSLIFRKWEQIKAKGKEICGGSVYSYD